jgi:hypothetical protein
MAIDPVCKMEVEESKAVATSSRRKEVELAAEPQFIGEAPVTGYVASR